MLRSYILTAAFTLAAFSAQAQGVAALADRIAKLAEREPVASAIDTQLRAAKSLMPVDPVRSKKFLSQALLNLRSHPEVPRTKGMTDSLLFLNPPDAEFILLAGTDRIHAYEFIYRHWRLLEAGGGVRDHKNAIFRRALEDPTVTPGSDQDGFVRDGLSNLAVVDPRSAAVLFLKIAGGRSDAKSASALPGHLDAMLTSFGYVLPARATGVREALATLLPTVRNSDFAASTAESVARFPIANGLETRHVRETILFRYGVLLHALAPDLYKDASSLFTPWESILATVNSPQEAARMSRPAPEPRLTFSEALTAAERQSPGTSRINAYADLLWRNDKQRDQVGAIVERALEEVASIPSTSESLNAVWNLLDAIRELPVDPA